MRDQNILGVEGGATRSSWVLYSVSVDGVRPSHPGGTLDGTNVGSLALERTGVVGAMNMLLRSDEELLCELQKLPKDVDCVGVFLAGCLTTTEKNRLQTLTRTVWPSAAKIVVGSDRDSTFAGAVGPADVRGICVNAGTGSCVVGFARIPDDGTIRFANAGGNGHVVGDEGSAYWIGLKGLKAAAKVLKKPSFGPGIIDEGKLGSLILRDICGSTLSDLAIWSTTASKSDIAGLCPVVFEAFDSSSGKDEVAKSIIEKGAKLLAQDAERVAVELGFEPKDAKVYFMGSVFEKQPVYVELFERQFGEVISSEVKTGNVGAEGAAMLVSGLRCSVASVRAPQKSTATEIGCCDDDVKEMKDMARALTEQRNPRSLRVDTMTPQEIVDLFVEEEDLVRQALVKSRLEIRRALDVVTEGLKKGGRLFYVGAGTSGRLGVLDASEIPPTFGEPPSTVQGIIAGGVKALYKSIEGAEDVAQDGADALVARGVTAADVVCGIGASGRTPFVLGALRKANDLGCATIFLTCNPARNKDVKCTVEIDLETGPELVTGSTRLKAGTATKVCINILTTGAMIRMGRVKSNLMVSLQATNVKLQDRAARLVSKLRDWEYNRARQALIDNNWDVVQLTSEKIE